MENITCTFAYTSYSYITHKSLTISAKTSNISCSFWFVRFLYAFIVYALTGKEYSILDTEYDLF